MTNQLYQGWCLEYNRSIKTKIGDTNIVISYKEACEHAQFDPYKKSPSPNTVFFAYKKGEYQKFTSKTEAKKYSSLIEEVPLNQDEIDDFWKEQQQRENEAARIFKNALQSEYYNNLTDKQFRYIWSQAWDRSHSYGFDEVAHEFVRLYEFLTGFPEN